MNVRAHRAFAALQRQFAKSGALLQPWRGAAYRVTTLDYPNEQSILSGAGSWRWGGRWNAPGSFRAVYGSTSDLVAVAESRATAEYAGIPHVFRTPRLLVAIEFDLARVLDLTVPKNQVALGISSEELDQEDWRKIQAEGDESLTQAIGRAAFESGANALLVPSAKVPNGINVAYFPENQSAPGEASVCESGQLDQIRVSKKT